MYVCFLCQRRIYCSHLRDDESITAGTNVKDRRLRDMIDARRLGESSFSFPKRSKTVVIFFIKKLARRYIHHTRTRRRADASFSAPS